MHLFKRKSSRGAAQKQTPSRRPTAAPTVPPPTTIANSTLDLRTSCSSIVLDDSNITPLPSSPESQHRTLVKPVIGRKILNDQNANGSRRSTSSRSHASQTNCDLPSFSQPNVVTPTSKDANDRMYLQNTLNTFTFGAPRPPSFSSSSVDPLTRPRGETDSDELIYKADTTPRPSVVGSQPSRSHSSQSHSAAGGTQYSLPSHPPSSAARRDRSQTRDTDTASCHTFGMSSASASVSSLSSASGLNSLAGSQISGQSNNTPQTSTNEFTSDDDIDHHHPLPPNFVQDVSSSRRFGAESSTYLSEEDFDDDSDFDQDDQEIYVGSEAHEGSDRATYFDHVNPSRESLYDTFRMAYGERRGSLAIATSGMPSNYFHDQGRYREDSATTLRRPSKSLEYLRSSDMGEPSRQTEELLAPTSVPESEGDWRDLRKKSLQRDKDAVLPLVAASPMAASITVTSASANNSATSGIDTAWGNWAGGITGFDPSEMNDIIAPMPAGRRPSDRVFRRESTNSERRLSVVSCNSGDFFHKTLARNWGGEGYKNQQQKWTFQREKADRLQSEDEPRRGDRERHSISNLFSPRPSTAPSAGIFDRHDPRDNASGKEKAKEQYWRGMAVDAEEWWFSHTNGRYKVNRKNAQAIELGKAPQQRLNITHHRTPYANQRDLADGPIVSIHKHSKAVAFSISRHYRLRPTATPKTTTSSLRPPTTSRIPSTPTNVDANRKKSTSMILLGPRRVQEAYTSTTTTRKLESHGLLDESGRTSPRDLERMKRERDRERKAKEKGKKKETENAKKSRSNKSKSDPPKQEISSESSMGSAGAISSGGSSTLVSGPSRIADSSPAVNIACSATSTSHSIMTQETTSSDRTVSRTRYRRHVGDDEDDDDLLTGIKRPTRTPHQEAYDTIPPDNPEPTTSQENGFGSLFGWGKQRNASSSSRAKAIRESYKPPWAVAPSRHNSEVRKGIVDDLNMSFQDVGLLPALHEIKGTHHSSQKRRHEQQSSKHSRRLTSDAAQADIFEDIPTDSLYMLLPLWPGETDAKSAQKYPYTMPTISTDSRQYLLIYYKVPLQTPAEQEQQKLKSQTGVKNSKRARNSPTSSHDSVKNRDHVLLTTFHISARVVAYHDLQGSGVRIPDQGLAVQGPLADAYGSMPTSIRDQGLVDWVIGVCHSREAGIEFVPESLEKMGLCRTFPNSPTLSTRDLRDEEDEEESDLVLTPIGRAVIEMAWLGGMALTSFGPGI